MRKAYIILAHKNLDQVTRLVKKLDDNSSSFFIHIDKKVPQLEFSRFQQHSANVHLVERINTQWGKLSLVEATLNGMKAVKESGIDFQMISLLSGQDYPIKSNKFIDNFYSTSNKRVFIEYCALPNFTKWKNGGGMYKVNKYYIGWQPHHRLVGKAFNFVALMLPFLRRKLPGRLVPYYGSQWWTIDMYALNYILDYVKQHPDYSTYHRYTFAPDEVYFQTILLNATDEKLLSSIENNHKRHMVWVDVGHPEILTIKDLNGILASDAFFARKFDTHLDAGILDAIDKECLLNPVSHFSAPAQAQ